jgi:predicted phage gp36 major capsid-like protein
MSALSDQADRDLLLTVIYEEYFRIAENQRNQHHWVMDTEMLRMVRRLKGSDGMFLWVPLPDVDWLLSLPVEIREGVEGIHLVPNETDR